MTLRGRAAELDRLQELVERPDGRFAVVCGSVGIGKTAVIEELAAQVDVDVVRIPWRDKESLGFQLMAAFGVLREDSARLWEIMAAAGRQVVIVEDAERPADILAMVDRLFERDYSGLVIVTSWDDDPRAWGKRAELIRLRPLSTQDAGDLLLELAPDGGDRRQASLLAGRLDRVPLGLTVAGRAIEESRATFEGCDADQTHIVEWALDRLVDEGFPHARMLLRFLAVAADAPLPWDVVAPLVDEAEVALAGLQRYGLVRAEELALPCISTHTLVREGLRDELYLVHPRKVLDEALLAAGEAAADSGRAGWDRCDLLAPHLVPIAARNTESWDTLDRVGVALYAAGRTSQVMLRRAVLEADPGNPNPRRHNLGLARYGVGDYAGAVDSYRQALAGYERDLGVDHRQVLSTQHCLGQALDKLGAHREAVVLLEHVLAALDPDDPETLVLCGNLGVACYNVRDYQRSTELHRRAYEGFEDYYGPDHSETLTSRGNLGVALLALGERDEAVTILRQNLGDRERLLGPDHPDVRLDRTWLAKAEE